RTSMTLTILLFYSFQGSRIVQIRSGFSRRRQGTASGEVVCACHQELFGGEARDKFTAVLGDNDLFFQPRSGPTVGRWPVGLESEDHSLFDDFRIIERN